MNENWEEALRRIEKAINRQKDLDDASPQEGDFESEAIGLDLSKLELISLPEEINKINLLSDLNLSNNCFKEIPELIRGITVFNEVNLANNQIEEIPDWFCTHFAQTKTLNLQHNKIQTLPQKIFETKASKHIEPNLSPTSDESEILLLGGNDIQSPPFKILKKGKEFIIHFYWEKTEHPKNPRPKLSSYRILAISQNDTEKKHLLQNFHRTEEKPSSIQNLQDINTFHFNDLSDKDVFIWDISNYLIDNNFFQIFLQRRQPFFIVLRSQESVYHATCLINQCKYISSEDPIKVVIDTKDASIPDKKIEEIKKLTGLSKSTFKNFDFLKEKTEVKELISHLSLNIERSDGQLLPDWDNLVTTIKEISKTNKIISYRELENHLTQFGASTPELRAYFTRILHNLGLLLHFPESKSSKCVLLDFDILKNAYQKLLNESKRRNGFFSDKDVNSLWEEKELLEWESELLEILLHCQIIFKTIEFGNGKYFYFIQSALSKIIPDHQFPPDSTEVIIDFKEPQPDLIPLIIRKYYPLNQNNQEPEFKLIWNKGIINEKEGFSMESIPVQNKLILRFWGINILWRLEEACNFFSEYRDINHFPYIYCKCQICLNLDKDQRGRIPVKKLLEVVNSAGKSIECPNHASSKSSLHLYPSYKTNTKYGITKDDLKDLVGTGKHEEALKQLIEIKEVFDHDTQNTIIILSSEWTEMKKITLSGAENEDLIIRKNKWKSNLLQIIHNLPN